MANYSSIEDFYFTTMRNNHATSRYFTASLLKSGTKFGITFGTTFDTTFCTSFQANKGIRAACFFIVILSWWLDFEANRLKRKSLPAQYTQVVLVAAVEVACTLVVLIAAWCCTMSQANAA